MTVGLREGIDSIGAACGVVAITLATLRIKLERGAAGDYACEGAVDEVAQNYIAGLRGVEQSAVVGDVALDMPKRSQIVAGLRGGSEIEIHKAQVNDGAAVELSSRGDAEIRREDDFLPRAGAAGGRRELITLYVEVDELKIGEQLDDAGLFVRAWYQGISRDRVGRTDLETRVVSLAGRNSDADKKANNPCKKYKGNLTQSSSHEPHGAPLREEM